MNKEGGFEIFIYPYNMGELRTESWSSKSVPEMYYSLSCSASRDIVTPGQLSGQNRRRERQKYLCPDSQECFEI